MPLHAGLALCNVQRVRPRQTGRVDDARMVNAAAWTDQALQPAGAGCGIGGFAAVRGIRKVT